MVELLQHLGLAREQRLGLPRVEPRELSASGFGSLRPRLPDGRSLPTLKTHLHHSPRLGRGRHALAPQVAGEVIPSGPILNQASPLAPKPFAKFSS